MTDTATPDTQAPTRHPKLLAWVTQIAELTQPDARPLVRRLAEEYDQLCQTLVAGRNVQAARSASCGPDRYLARSDPGDVARVEDRTFICSAKARTTPARPTTGSTRRDARRRSHGLFEGSMRGRTMYVVPFSMGPLGSDNPTSASS